MQKIIFTYKIFLTALVTLQITNFSYASDKRSENPESYRRDNYRGGQTEYTYGSPPNYNATPLPYRPYSNNSSNRETLNHSFSSLNLSEYSSDYPDSYASPQFINQNSSYNPQPFYHTGSSAYSGKHYIMDDNDRQRLSESRRTVINPSPNYSGYGYNAQESYYFSKQAQPYTQRNTSELCGNCDPAPSITPLDNMHNKAKGENYDQKINIPVFFHHLMDSKKNGKMTSEMRNKQIQVLNNTYSEYNINFIWDEWMFTEDMDDGWFSMKLKSNEETQAKLKLRVIPEKCLNLYTCKPKDQLLGWATFPWELKDNSEMDGIVISYDTFPGGKNPSYNLGKTTVHETGHWLGLYHTFENGCDGNGDEVDDTIAHSGPNYNLTENNACKPGEIAPFDNYMNYGKDKDMKTFTKGQISRIFQQTNAYRKDLISWS